MEVATMNNNGMPLGTRKKIQLLLLMTFLAWATHLLLHQWGYGAEVIPTEAGADGVSAEKFVPGTARYAAGAALELRSEAIVYGAEIKLKQVCRWSDRDAKVFEPIADLVLTHFQTKAAFASISIDELKQILHDA